jgi:hypothetical protein
MAVEGGVVVLLPSTLAALAPELVLVLLVVFDLFLVKTPFKPFIDFPGVS